MTVQHERRDGVDRRVIQGAWEEGTCAIHGEVIKRIDERLGRQDVTNTLFDGKIDKINGKLNWIMGGIVIGIPLVQTIFGLVIHLISKGYK
jgi:hypothetical protein